MPNTAEKKMSQVNLSKQELRDLMHNKRLQLMKSGRQRELSRLIQLNVLSEQIWKVAQYVLLYHACKDEIDTSLLLQAAWQENKKVFLPRCIPGKFGQMQFFPIVDTTKLILSSYGIMEPPAEGSEPDATMAAHGLIIVPGLAFERHGFRLGYGGGYYDRLLTLRQEHTIGLVFSELLLDELPRDPWDVPVQTIATEDGLIWL